MPDTLGRVDERVRIAFGDEDIQIVESYEITIGWFTQPAAFAVRVGSGGVMRDLLQRFRPGISFKLYLGPALQFSGIVDEVTPAASGKATELTIKGRDYLGRVMNTHATEQRSFSSKTYKDLCLDVLKLCSFADPKVEGTNAANRKTQAAQAPINEFKVPRRLEGSTIEEGQAFLSPLPTAYEAAVEKANAEFLKDWNKKLAEGNFSGKQSTQKKLQIKLGEVYYEWLRKELDRAGFFILAGAEPETFIVTEPNANQKPLHKIVRQRGASRNVVNVTKPPRFKNSATGRFTTYTVYGRGGGGKDGRTKVKGVFVDEEMLAWGFPYTWAVQDDAAKSTAAAQHLARRACADARRKGWELVYEAPGHFAPVVGTPDKRAPWTRDTVVLVEDDEYGIVGPHWLESVTFRGGGNEGTVTELHLMRPEDLVFGEGFKKAKKV